jgi:hypothetical protein
MRGRNYSLCGTLHVDATIMGEWSANLTLGLLLACPLLSRMEGKGRASAHPATVTWNYFT